MQKFVSARFGDDRNAVGVVVENRVRVRVVGICSEDRALLRLVGGAQRGIKITTAVGDGRGLEGVACTYVRLTNDATLLPSTQDAFIDALDDPEILHLEAGHMAMISQPEALARIVERCRRGP